MNEPKIYFLDIDGCIMPEAFPTLSEESQTPEIIKGIIDSVNEKGQNIKPYKSFSSFFFNNITKNDYVYFVTGRQRSAFGNLTYQQLYKYLFNDGNIEIIFYPETGKYTADYYFDWKYQTIKKLLREESTHYIFDDNGGYFQDLLKLDDYHCKCYSFNKNTDWKRFNRQIIKNEKKNKETDRTLTLLILSDDMKFTHPLIRLLDKIYKNLNKILDWYGERTTSVELYLFRKYRKKRIRNELKFKKKKEIKKPNNRGDRKSP